MSTNDNIPLLQPTLGERVSAVTTAVLRPVGELFRKAGQAFMSLNLWLRVVIFTAAWLLVLNAVGAILGVSTSWGLPDSLKLSLAFGVVEVVALLLSTHWWDNLPAYARWAAYGLAILFALLVFPSGWFGTFMSPDIDWASILFFPIGGYILLALGLNIVVGMAGLLDLGYVAFFAIGAYSVAYLGRMHHWSFWPAVGIGLLLAAFAGIVLGAPTLRLRGDYLAIVTLGFGEIVRIVALNTNEIGGAQGIDQIPQPPDMFGLSFGLDPKPYYYLMLFFIVLVVIVTRRLENSRVGRAWAAIREDEDAAELMGVPTFKFKLLAFFVGAMVGGLGGAGTIGGQGPSAYIQPQDFPFILSATILVCVVFGGSGNVPGVIFGAFLVAWVPERLRFLQDWRIMIFGAVLMVMMIFRPEGLLPSRRRKAELAEGTGGMGSMGAEISGPGTQGSVEVTS